MKTLSPTPKQIERHWHVIDLKDKVLGRAAVEIANLLMGKNKPYFSPHIDCGDYVVVINAGDVELTGRKAEQKIYRHHTGRPGGFREIPFSRMMDKDPRTVITHAVSGMLPKNKLRDQRLKRLKIFVSNEHPYEQLAGKNDARE